MKTFWLMVLLIFYKELFLYGIVSTLASTIPKAMNIGVVISFETTIGKVAKVAIEAAIKDVNSDPTTLVGTEIKATMQDSNRSGILAIAQALKFMERETVAIIGPQDSATAHVVSHVSNELHVPLLSFSASDPTLSSLQFPYFVRTGHSDLYQMAAIAEIVDYYGWREVIAIYGDDEHGRNGIAALGDKLAAKRCKITFKARLCPTATKDEITNLLVKVALSESRIFVVHTSASLGIEVFHIAHYLGMMGSGYVWIATDWLCTVLDTNSPLSEDEMEDIQGVLSLRIHAPNSVLRSRFISKWKNLTSAEKSDGPIGLNTHGLYAYDTVWLLAHAIDSLFRQGGNISFSKDSRLAEIRGGKLHLDALNIFDEGNLLLQSILQVNMTGLSGPIKFNSDGDLMNPAYELINVIGTAYRRIGYWSNHSGISVVPPEVFSKKQPNHSSSNQTLYSVIWPGQTSQKPRGWVFPNNGRHLKIGIPHRVSFREFVSVTGTDSVTGFCIDVFTAALNLLPYALPYKFIPFGDGHNNPSGTELVRLITAGVYDAAVGDITIITNRTRMVDFTQPYVESGLVVVAPVWKSNSNEWAFLRPFSPLMWGVIAVFFLAVGAIVWTLEHRQNDDFRGPPKRQVVTIFWFSFSTMFFAHRENVVSSLGRLVIIIWLFVVFIINSSYTASLTSILTVQQLSSPIKGINSLKSNNDPIGYQYGSFVRNYLVDELNIDESRLVPFNSAAEFAKALKDGPHKGGVAAVIDERAYIELFLSTRCEFSIVGKEFTKNGWGFAFPRDSPLVEDMSTAILKLSESGDLQRIHDKWLLRSACTLQGAKLDVDRLQLKSFWGLFLLCGLACVAALFIYLIQMMRQFSRHCPEDIESSTRSSRSTRIQTFLSFVDEKEEEVKGRSKRRHIERTSYRKDEDRLSNASSN
ncbi:hypothetical protein Ddye_010753 [Dipteronia dyeriana]|uniref:Glutamate receptor n=1 Tax=Dipteronia dyeriana TaxID=168575 RepID=A0AAE0CNK4_9ROSI|nr:hypothetical protein Ddye_010753 [Dipteronia dyeriana]